MSARSQYTAAVLAPFLDSFFEGAEVRVPAPGDEAAPAELLDDAAHELLRERAAVAALELPGPAPAFEPTAGAWAALVVLRAAQALLYRELRAHALGLELARACPAGRGAAADWSADLCLRHLPELHRRARGVAADDPLVAALEELGRRWPLSSVGMEGLDGVDAPRFAEHAGLRRFYVDRILARGDLGRLADPHLAEEARVILGAHPELCREAAALLNEEVAS